MAQLRLSLLGSPEVWSDQQALTFPTRKALALLIYLAVEKGLHSREKLQTLLWPDSEPERGRGALRTTLAYLRRGLDVAATAGSKGYLLSEPDTLGFNFASDFELDLHLVERAIQVGQEPLLDTAIEVYRADFLEGFSLPDAPAFDEWTSLQREHWHRQMNSLFDRLSRQQAEGRHFGAGIATATRWIAHDPLNEAAHRRLMQLYFMTGERATALQAYAACQQLLLKELGAAPSTETRILAERIRTGDVRLPMSDFGSKPPHHKSPIANRKSQIVNRKSVDMPFVGRSTEHAQLAAAYQLAVQGQTHMVVIEGEAGIGKTRLATEFLGWLSLQGADCWQGVAFEAGGRLPYQPIIDALRGRLERENAPDDLLGDVWLAELSRLLPELRDRYPDLPAPSGDESLARTRMLEAVVRLGQALAERSPIVIFIDDIQWADIGSLDLLHYTGQRWAESQVPLLLLLTLRIEALAIVPALGEWLSNVGRHVPLTHLTLGPITADDTLQLINTLAGSSSAQAPALFARWLFTETAGQPFFMTETIKTLIERDVLQFRPEAEGSYTIDFAGANLRGGPLIPPGVRQVILARLNRLQPAAAALLTAAAVIGRNCSFERLCQVAGIAEMEGLPALDELLAGRLLLESHELARPYRFVHDKIRDVVYTEAGDARRRIYHRRAFEALEIKFAPSAELAHHALAARLDEPAFRYSLAAGDEAMTVFAVRDAVVHYEQALTLATGKNTTANLHRLYLQLGRAYELTGEPDKARAIYEAMLVYAQGIHAPETECAALNRLATLTAQITYDIERAMTFLQQALPVAENNHDHVGLAETEWNLAQLSAYMYQLETSEAHGQRALALARQLALPELTARSLTVVGFVEIGLARWADSEGHYEEACLLSKELGNRALETESLCGIARARVNAGCPQAAVGPARAAHTINLESDNQWGQGVSAFHLALALSECGEYGEALETAQAGVNVARIYYEFAPLPILNLTVLGIIHRAMLNVEAAQAAHQEAIAVSESRPYQPLLRMTAAELCADSALLGDWAAAHHYARQSLTAVNHSLLHGGLWHWYITEALLRGGDIELARADLVRFGEQFASNRRYQIPYRRCQAVLAQWEDDIEQAISHLEEAHTLAKELNLPGEQRQILAALRKLYQANRLTS